MSIGTIPRPLGYIAPVHLAPPEPQIVVESADDSETEALAARVRREVFEREWNIQVPPLPENAPGEVMTFIAREKGHPWPAAVLTVMDTTGNHNLHEQFGLLVPPESRVARYTQLAVLRPYRGMNIPVQLVSEARRRFVIPQGFDCTWLLFNAKHATSSPFCTALGFEASTTVFDTEYGPSRVLTRTEGPVRLTATRKLGCLTSDEWVAQ